MKLIERFGVILALVLLFVAFSVYDPDAFLTSSTMLIIVTSQSTVIILALALTIPLRAGEFDLSIGSIMVLSASTTGLLQLDHDWSLGALLVVSIALGAAAGLLNAILVVGFGINGFIATLGTSSILAGIGYGITDSQLVGPVEGSIIEFSRTSWHRVPAAVFIGWGIALVLWLVLERTVLGRYWLFAGGNPQAAHLAGVPTRLVKALSYVVSGAICGFAGLLLLGTLGSADPSVSGAYLLAPFAAAFVGTAVLQGGRFNVIGTVVGTYLISVATIGLVLFGAPQWFGQVFSGLILVLALGVARLERGSRTVRLDPVAVVDMPADGPAPVTQTAEGVGARATSLSESDGNAG
jgi:ribose transport system permease protein